MRIFEVVYVTGEKLIVFGERRSDVQSKHPLAWLVYEVIVK